MKWISEETLKDCQIFRYSPMGNGKEGVRPVTVDELPGFEVGSDWAIPGSDRTGFIKHPCEGCPTPVIGCADWKYYVRDVG